MLSKKRHSRVRLNMRWGSTPIKILERMIDNHGLSLKLYETVPIIIQVLLAITSFESQL